MIAGETLDAVVVATPPQFRAPILEAAFARDLPVFVEKPLAGTLDGARERSRPAVRGGA